MDCLLPSIDIELRGADYDVVVSRVCDSILLFSVVLVSESWSLIKLRRKVMDEITSK